MSRRLDTATWEKYIYKFEDCKNEITLNGFLYRK